MGKPKYKKFFPEKVYWCGCLACVIAFCLVNEIYSLVDICKKVNETIHEKIFCVKCGENQQNAIFSCGDHMPMIIFAVETSQSFGQTTATISFRDETKTYCRICVKKYLQEMYYRFEYVNFKLNHKKLGVLIFTVVFFDFVKNIYLLSIFSF